MCVQIFYIHVKTSVSTPTLYVVSRSMSVVCLWISVKPVLKIHTVIGNIKSLTTEATPLITLFRTFIS